MNRTMSAIFRQLTAGIKFDKRKYRQEAEKFGLVKKCENEEQNENFEKTISLTLEDDFVPDSNLPTPDDSGEENSELQLLGSISAKKKLKKKKSVKSKQDLKKLYQEKINHFRKLHHIHIKGTDIPDPIDTWDKLKVNYGVPEDVLAVLKLSYEKPTPVQMQTLPLMLDRRETLVCAPTGSGKTVSYLLPLVHQLREPRNKKGFRAVIVAPTRELASQIFRECEKLCEPRKLRPFMIDNVSKSAKKISGQKLDILVTTPNRLVYMINNEQISMKNVEWLIVDESDKLFETTGKGETSFRDQLATIYRACSEEGEAQLRRAFFSATLATEVEEWCSLNLDNVASVTIGQRHTATDTIKQTLVYTGTEKGKLLAFRQLMEKGQLRPPVLVFVQEKDRAKDLFNELIKEKIHVDVIHSERSQLQRDNSVRAFRAGQIWVLICTELMGRGIDFKGVNLVINYDFPTSTVSYIHRIGRTGRAGRQGEAITFFTDKDKTLLRDVASIVKRSGGEVPEFMLKMKKASRQDKRKMAKSAVKREGITKEAREKQRKLKKRPRDDGNQKDSLKNKNRIEAKRRKMK